MLIFPTYNILKGLFVVWYAIVDTANAGRFQGKLPDLSLISTVFNTFIKPYLKTWHAVPQPRAFEEVERTVERVVKEKIKQLQPFLQDYDTDEGETDNEITFEGNDETTIIEFVPQINEVSKIGLRNGNDTFKTNMGRYKRVRNKIYEVLEAEKVSDKTKTFVIRTLDELLSKMVETQCHWMGGIEKTDNTSSRFIIPKTIVNMWREEWQKFKNNFSTLTYRRARNQFSNFDNLMIYLTRLNKIINDVSINLESFANKYRILCNISERKDYKKNKLTAQNQEPLRLSYESDNDKDICKNFKLCSKELKEFFIDFYTSVNDTTVNILRSYAEMFTRDVNTDVSNEKNSIIELIYKVADQTEKDVIKIFVNYTTQFQLDQHKEKDANMKFLLHFVKNVIQHVKAKISKHMTNKLNHLHKKISSSIQRDVEVNLDVDLGNLERDLTGKICLIFNICNGNSKYRRHGDNKTEEENTIDNKNKIFVKVELTVDEERKDLLNSISDSKTIRPVPELNTKKIPDNFGKSHNFKDVKTSLNYEKYANISVTRTTLTMKGS